MSSADIWNEGSNFHEVILSRLFAILSVPACYLWMEISFSFVLERNTLMKNEVKEDGGVAVSAPAGETPH